MKPALKDQLRDRAKVQDAYSEVVDANKKLSDQVLAYREQVRLLNKDIRRLQGKVEQLTRELAEGRKTGPETTVPQNSNGDGEWLLLDDDHENDVAEDEKYQEPLQKSETNPRVSQPACIHLNYYAKPAAEEQKNPVASLYKPISTIQVANSRVERIFCSVTDNQVSLIPFTCTSTVRIYQYNPQQNPDTIVVAKEIKEQWPSGQNKEETSSYISMDFSPTTNVLVAFTSNYKLQIWDINTQKLNRECEYTKNPEASSALNSKGNRMDVICFLGDGMGLNKVAIRNPSQSSAVSFYDLENISCFEKIVAPFPVNGLRSIGDYLLLYGEDLAGVLRDPKSKEKVGDINFLAGGIPSPSEPLPTIMNIEHNKNHEILAVLSNGQVVGFDIRNLKEAKSYYWNKGVSSASFVADKNAMIQRLAFGFADGTVKVVDSRSGTGNHIQTILKHTNLNEITSINSSQNQMMITGDSAGLMSLWVAP